MNVFETQLLAVANAYAEASGVALSTASDRAVGDPRILPRLAAGTHSLTVARADRALHWFSAHWPEGVEWPADVPRPLPAAAADQPEQVPA